MTAAVLLLTMLMTAIPAARADESPSQGAAQASVDAAEVELASAEATLAEITHEVATLDAHRTATASSARRLEAAAADAAVERYMHASVEDIAILGGDLIEPLTPSAMADVAVEARQVEIDKYAASLRELDAASVVLRERTQKQQTLVKAMSDWRAALTQQLRRVAELERQQREREVIRLAKAKEKAAAAAAAAAAAWEAAAAAAAWKAAASGPAPTSPAAAPSAPASSGGWICPVQGPVSFVDSWGFARSGGRAHKGVDLMAARGVPTVAPVSGRVVHKQSGLGGLTWYVYGDDGNRYYGAHLSGYANQGVGHVSAGTVIGYVGDSGNAAGANHLHFEIHPGGGSPTNPYPTVARAC